eukprot:COSAG02_NODE_477_length_21523_cov_11.763163_1_plen_21_part_10
MAWERVSEHLQLGLEGGAHSR